MGVASSDRQFRTITPSESGFPVNTRQPDLLGVTQIAALRSSNTYLLNFGVLAVSGDKKRADLVEQINGEEDDHQGERVASRGNDGSEHE